MKAFCSPRLTAFAVALAAVAAVAFGPAVSRADTIYSLNTPNAALSAVPGPYGSVTVSLTDSTHASVTFTSADVNKFRFGGAQAVDFNANGAVTASISSYTGAPGGGSIGDLTGPTAGNVSDFGAFNNTFDNFDGNQHTFSSVTFALTKSSGSWGNSNAVLTANADGSTVAAHIFAYASDGSVIVTGFAGNGPLVTPEFGSASLMGLMLLGFCGIAGFQRFRKPALV
jgi:hypothetical protein